VAGARGRRERGGEETDGWDLDVSERESRRAGWAERGRAGPLVRAGPWGKKREKDRAERKERGVGDGPPGKGVGPRGRRGKLGCRKEGMGCRVEFSFLSPFLFFLKLTQFYLNSNEIGIQT
jgi:hypothetical protein